MNLEMIALLKNLGKDVKVLFVEDNDNVRAGTYNILNTFFEDITMAVDGLDGLEIYRYQPNYDLIITDVSMVKMSGLDMIREIRKINPKQKSIVISAHTESDKLEDAESLGVSSYIAKPIILKELVPTLVTIIKDIKNLA